MLIDRPFWLDRIDVAPPRRDSKQVAGAQPLDKIARWKNQDTVLGAAALGLEADDDPLLDPRMVLGEGPESLQVVCGDLGGGLGLDRELHVVDDEIHFDAAGQTPVTEFGERLGVRVVGGQLGCSSIYHDHLKHQLKTVHAIAEEAPLGERDPPVSNIGR